MNTLKIDHRYRSFRQVFDEAVDYDGWVTIYTPHNINPTGGAMFSTDVHTALKPMLGYRDAQPHSSFNPKPFIGGVMFKHEKVVILPYNLELTTANIDPYSNSVWAIFCCPPDKDFEWCKAYVERLHSLTELLLIRQPDYTLCHAETVPRLWRVDR